MIKIAKIAFGVAMLCAMGVSARAEILIATVGPLKGQYAALGEQLRQGVSRAVADINASGGVNGEQLVLEVADDGCDPKQAMAVANELVAKGVKFVAGHYCSGSSIAAAKIYEDAGIIMISPSSTSPKFTDDGGWNVHRVCGRDDAQGAFAGRAVAKAYAGKTLPFLMTARFMAWGLPPCSRAPSMAQELRRRVRESYKAGANDYNDLVQKMLAANVELIYIGGYAFEAGTIIRQMRDFASSAVLVGGDALLVEQFWATSGTSGEGTLVTFAPDAQKSNSARP